MIYVLSMILVIKAFGFDGFSIVKEFYFYYNK